MTDDAMIVLKDLSKAYKVGPSTVRAVDSIDLEIPRGQLVSIVGHSGSGKTTLLSLMGGLTKPSSGRVIIDGTNIWNLSDKEMSLLRNEKIGFSFQFASLLPTLTSLDNVRLPSTFGSRNGTGDNGRSADLLKLVGLEDRMYSYPGQLSGGEQRRVALARTLMNQPKLILADEPTGDLDEDTEADILEIFKRINSEGITIVIVTHSRAVASQAQRALRMNRGHLAEDSD
ncbi:MAG: ABC transporter ATP-binding protein [Actinobacteria bacterium]|nr:ABC transporter ATP-binding protein [Actinomycetota bacterium]MCL5882381.1 ABC transporter ATP-binding protein [Actinomycetota bacterium]